MSDRRSLDADFTTLYLTYYPKIFKAAYSLLKSKAAAEDVTQSVFLRLYENWNTARPANVEGYVVTMAKNMILNQFRSNTVKARYRRFVKERFELGGGNVEDLAISRQRLQALALAVSELPPRQQQAWRLFREQGLTYQEIAHQMGISKTSVKELLQKATSAIKLAMEKLLFALLLLNYFFQAPSLKHKQGVNNIEPISRTYDIWTMTNLKSCCKGT